MTLLTENQAEDFVRTTNHVLTAFTSEVANEGIASGQNEAMLKLLVRKSLEDILPAAALHNANVLADKGGDEIRCTRCEEEMEQFQLDSSSNWAVINGKLVVHCKDCSADLTEWYQL